MEREFWQARWDEGRIGFHQDDINPHLLRHWPRLHVPAGSGVFVPLCGKSKDMLWLREQGYAVVGVEVVQRAIEAFFAENALQATQRRHRDFTLWEGNDLRLFGGDFFDLVAADLEGVAAVYDRASLVALPPALRESYAAHLRAILPQGAKVLLVTMDYPQREMDGPPFAVTEPEVHALYEAYFVIERVAIEDILAANPRFRQQGLTQLRENVYVLTPR